MELQGSLGYLLNVAARLTKQKLDNSLKRYDITTSQFAVLKMLSEHDEMNQVEVTKLMHSDKATYGAVIDKLGKKGLIEKRVCTRDKRAFVVGLTPKASQMIEEITLEAKKCNESVEKNFSTKEILEIKQILNKIIIELGD